MLFCKPVKLVKGFSAMVQINHRNNSVRPPTVDYHKLFVERAVFLYKFVGYNKHIILKMRYCLIQRTIVRNDYT